MKRRLLAGILLAMATTGCSTRPSPQNLVQPEVPVISEKLTVSSPTDALRVVSGYLGANDLTPFPNEIGIQICSISRGGPVSKKATIQGTCETKTEQDGNMWIVGLIQTWDAKDFSEVHSPAQGILKHTRQFRISSDGKVVGEETFGDFPPQMAK